MYGMLLAVHVLICIGLIAVVLLQSGKGGGLAGGAFGGTAQTVFGGRGATDFMTRATMVLGGAFFVTSLVLALLSSNPGRASRSLIQEQARRAPAAAPQMPGTAPGPQSPGGSAPAQPPPASTPPATPPTGGGGK
jgi:preprotein translocase subunit SecG